ncbi:hypothetical protein RJT34_23534 [Clitoria ternatea]|uniref:Cellulose synthase-like protein G2 n=1 Tax=Clitoria ternatea TaxID=43366 RepID=A0AAN9FLD3_CLITE
MEETLPLNLTHVNKPLVFTNRLHMLLHFTALSFLVYYRLCFFFQDAKTRGTPVLPWFLVFSSEIILSFIWILDQAFRWHPVSRTVFPERLPEDAKLPHIDVFICTADPTKEPTVDVMNTVLSAMALDYPPEKLHVYVSDDGGSVITLNSMRETWKFSRWWLPFCIRYRITCRCPKAYFSASENDEGGFAGNIEFLADRKMVQAKYETFKESIRRVKEDQENSGDAIGIIGQNHPPIIEVIHENSSGEIEQVELPSLVYVSREKKPSYPHHFKAGALNALYRVSAVISNAPYVLVLDCDMFCNDPASARQALCFHLDPKLSPSLAFVQFPQKFHNISENDIYDSQHRSAYKLLWHGMDGLKGPVLSGTGFYMKRESLYGNYKIKDTDLELQQYVGTSKEFIKSLNQNYTEDSLIHTLPEETLHLASCNYETGTKWGKEVGFLYGTVCEDVHTGFMLNCNGWNSVLCDPPKPQFLGNSTTNLNDLLVQGIRWYSGLLDIGLSSFCPLITGPLRMSLLQSLCYAQLTYFTLYCLPLWCFASVPQLCLVNGIPLYPKVSDPFFFIFLFIFLSAVTKHLVEVLSTGGTFRKWVIEQRIWMMRSITSHLYGCWDVLEKKFGIREASFVPTNKVEDDDKTMLYQMDKYDFRTSNMFLVPMVAILIINIACIIGGIYRVLSVGDWDKMFIQLFFPAYIIVVNYPIIEGLVIRKDIGRIYPSVALVVTSNILAAIITSTLYSLLRKV